MSPAALQPEPPSGDVHSTLKFYNAPKDGSTPYYKVEATEAISTRNYGQEDILTKLHDIRGHESEFQLDLHGFMAIKGVTSAESIDFSSDEDIRTRYYLEVAALLRSILEFDKIIVFDHTVRKDMQESPSRPVHHVHIDQTPWSARQRVYVHAPDDAEMLLQGRVRILNVWKPIDGPIWSEPLAYANSSTVQAEDLVAVEHILPTRKGETYALKQNKEQTWHYWSGMMDSDRIILQCFDSQSGSRVPHSAFSDPRTPADAPIRQSIEVRVLLFG